ncbi:glutamyl-tRNA reductase [Natranaerovirga pectinivora]|uniref:Glutamyl-tRNA reductase n=1 Tax=Natranaerovirga pectinivora TaxID=682400 RepID=A0A4V2V066_9FIRM|nr:glutamyl-tRNA reductase [Natranaerovirga pectinivora]TCT14248.1 glutamyl-tRNA reductase [Natranaerovirga pectinivora]
MQVGVISINHKKAPVEIREIAVFTDKKKIEAIDKLLELSIEEVVILSTCNRSEVYIASSNMDEALIEVKNFLIDYFKVKELALYLTMNKNEQAIEHIYKVAIGLDSVVIGEDQILGQVKNALEFAMEIGSSKKFLNKVFREAMTFAKKMKSNYRISENPLSIPYISVKFVKDRVKDLKNQKVLVIGTGEMGALVLKHLKAEGVKDIVVCSRSKSRCKKDDMDDIFNDVDWILYEERYTIVNDVDIIFSATRAPHIIYKKDRYPNVEKEQLIMDMAMPRDIDPRLSELKNVQVFNVDHLKDIAQVNMALREKIGEEIKIQLQEEVEKTSLWINVAKVDPIIQSLQSLREEVARDTLDIISKKMALNRRETVFLEKLINSSLKRMVRTPIKALKSLKEEDEIKAYKEMLHKLYDV